MAKNLISFLFLAAAVSLFWFWTKPMMEEIDGLNLQKNAMEKALADSRELQKLKDELFEKYSQISADDLSRMAKILPKEPESTKLLIQIDNVAKATAVTVKSFSVAEPVKPTGQKNTQKEEVVYAETKLNLSIGASYGSFLRFLEELESSLRLIDVVDIKFSSAEKDQYEITINAILYSQI